MVQKLYKPAVFALFIAALAACDDDNENEKPGLRAPISYTSLDTAKTYSEQFIDASNASTVSLAEGNTLHKMFQGLNYHSSSSISANTIIDAQKLHDLFTNTGDPFVDVATNTISIVGDDLNGSGFQLKENVAASLTASEAALVQQYIEDLFEQIATASESLGTVGSKGVAGKVDNYLVNAKGIELIQVIQKSLIGAFQLDYIGNYLMEEGLNADNTTIVAEENYTALEHNWDIAYGTLTLSPIYLRGATDAARKTTEFAGGAYIWEYNKADYAHVYAAYLKGRAAIVNNDHAQMVEQATFIRNAFEKAIANAAIGYLEKWKLGDTEAKRVHAFGEGLGFIYSLRFAKLHGADAAFSDHIIGELTASEFGYWDLEFEDASHAIDEIKEKFNL